MSSSGLVQVGYTGAQASQKTPQQVYIPNDDSDNYFVLENRYAGPLGLSWAKSDVSIQGGIEQPIGPSIHVPPLSRIGTPWPRDYGVNIFHRRGLGGAVQSHAANASEAIPNVWNYQGTNIRWQFYDAPGVGYSCNPVYPEGSRVQVARFGNSTQGGTPQAFHTLPFQTGAFAGLTPLALLLTAGADGTNPVFQRLSSDSRIMRVMVFVRGGAGQVGDLEVNVAHRFDPLGGEDQISYFTMGGVLAGNAAGVSIAQSPWINTDGAIAVWLDNDNGAAASVVAWSILFDIGVPFD